MIKDKILNLFLDNIQSDITPSDLRQFINAIFDSKENYIKKLKLLEDVSRVTPYPILKNDLVIVHEDEDNNGIYLALRNSPDVADLKPILVIHEVANPATREKSITDFVATQNQIVFICAYNIDNIDVYIEGVKVQPNKFTANDGTSIIMPPQPAGTWVEVVTYI